MFGYHVKTHLINECLAVPQLPVSVKGNPTRSGSAFAKAIGSEKRYIETARSARIGRSKDLQGQVQTQEGDKCVSKE